MSHASWPQALAALNARLAALEAAAGPAAAPVPAADTPEAPRCQNDESDGTNQNRVLKQNPLLDWRAIAADLAEALEVLLDAETEWDGWYRHEPAELNAAKIALQRRITALYGKADA